MLESARVLSPRQIDVDRLVAEGGDGTSVASR
jgi:hypothetical protein